MSICITVGQDWILCVLHAGDQLRVSEQQRNWEVIYCILHPIIYHLQSIILLQNILLLHFDMYKIKLIFVITKTTIYSLHTQAQFQNAITSFRISIDIHHILFEIKGLSKNACYHAILHSICNIFLSTKNELTTSSMG